MCAGGPTRRWSRERLQLSAAALAWLILAVARSGDAQPPAAPRAPADTAALRASEPIALVPKGSVTLGAETSERKTLRQLERVTRVRIPLNIEGAHGTVSDKRFKITDGAAEIHMDERGDPTIDLPAQGRTIVSSDEAAKTASLSTIVQEKKTPLPWLVIDTQETQSGPRVTATRPVLQLARAIQWDEKSQRHVAEILFGVDPEAGEPNDTPLDPPFRARFSVSCDEVTPAQAEIHRVGPAGYSTVRVACSSAVKNEKPTQYIEIHVGTGNLRYPFELPRRPGRPVLLASSTSLPGLGVGSTTLTVKRIEEDGSPLPADEELSIQLLAAGGGALDPSVLTLPKGEPEASVELRPAGLGSLEVSAVIGQLHSTPVRLELHWPWFAMLSMLAGAALGAFLGYVRSRRKHSYRRSAADVLSGVLVAAATMIVPALVTTMPSWARLTELYFFVIASVAAFLGLDAFEALARRLLPHLASKHTKAEKDASPVAK